MLDGSGNSYDPSASAWFAAMPTQPTAQVKGILNAFIVGLKNDSLWSLLDGGNFLCLETLDQIQMAHYGAGLDATQAANLNTRVQTAVAALTVL